MMGFLTWVTMWQIYLILGLLLCFLEIFVPGMVLLPFGIGALATAALAWLPLPSWALLLFWSFFSVVAWVGIRRWSQSLETPQHYRSAAEGFVGQQARVIEALDPVQGTGKVKLYSDEWQVLEPSEALPVGALVQVLEVQGNRLRVKSLLPESAPAEK